MDLGGISSSLGLRSRQHVRTCSTWGPWGETEWSLPTPQLLMQLAAGIALFPSSFSSQEDKRQIGNGCLIHVPLFLNPPHPNSWSTCARSLIYANIVNNTINSLLRTSWHNSTVCFPGAGCATPGRDSPKAAIEAPNVWAATRP